MIPPHIDTFTVSDLGILPFRLGDIHSGGDINEHVYLYDNLLPPLGHLRFGQGYPGEIQEGGG